MKIIMLFIPIFLLARENPFFLPNETPVVSGVKIEKSVPQQKVQPLKKESKAQKKEILKTISLPSAKIEVGNTYIRIFTSNRLLKSFFVTNPDKLVIDIASKKDFQTVRAALKSSFFSQIVIGAHKNYFRIVLKLTKKCSKEIRQIKGGYEIYCR